MTTLLEPVELRSRGFEVLVQSLGWVNAVRFIHQFERSSQNYTSERETLLPNLSPAEMVKQMTAVAKR
jgi:hypothetical protein